MPSVEARIAAVAEQIRRRAMEQAAPVDGLSASMFAWEKELTALDDEGKVGLLAELNQPSADGTMGLDLDMEALERMIEEAKP